MMTRETRIMRRMLKPGSWKPPEEGEESGLVVRNFTIGTGDCTMGRIRTRNSEVVAAVPVRFCMNTSLEEDKEIRAALCRRIAALPDILEFFALTMKCLRSTYVHGDYDLGNDSTCSPMITRGERIEKLIGGRR